jgi:hypothetical protein
MAGSARTFRRTLADLALLALAGVGIWLLVMGMGAVALMLHPTWVSVLWSAGCLVLSGMPLAFLLAKD